MIQYNIIYIIYIHVILNNNLLLFNNILDNIFYSQTIQYNIIYLYYLHACSYNFNYELQVKLRIV